MDVVRKRKAGETRLALLYHKSHHVRVSMGVWKHAYRSSCAEINKIFELLDLVCWWPEVLEVNVVKQISDALAKFEVAVIQTSFLSRIIKFVPVSKLLF